MVGRYRRVYRFDARGRRLATILAAANYLAIRARTATKRILSRTLHRLAPTFTR